MTVPKNDDCDAAALVVETVGIPVRWARADVTVEVDIGCPSASILKIVAMQHGLILEELIVIRDSDEEPLDHHAVIDRDSQHHRHHVHFQHPIEVTVHYKADSRHHEFRRHAIVERVLDWSIRVFNIDPAMAGEFELTLAFSSEELPVSEHLGHLAGKKDKLELNLVRGNIANGACHG